jgi:phage terminase small subunit
MILNPKQKRFCDEYLKDLNGTQAAIRAGYSKKTATEQSSRLLTNVKVQDFISSKMEKREKRTEITQDRVLQELARIAFFDIRNLIDEDGNPKPLDTLDDDTAAAIAGVDVYREKSKHEDGSKVNEVAETVKYKIADKNGALTLAMRHLGMLNDSLKLDVSNGLADKMKSARIRSSTPTK